jgi:hypothetical protein
VTAGNEENALATQAVAAGVAAEAAHLAAAEAQHRQVSGSAVAVEAASGPSDHAVQWTGSDLGAANGPSPQPHDRPPNPVVVTDTTTPHDL